MELHIIDIGIVFFYLALTVFIGFWISKKASQNLDSYFLGGRSIPGVSNASGMFDITGTMWLVYLCFVYGLKSVWIPWLWPVFNQIFLMVYLSIWLRRSNVLTGAEWIQTRFGQGFRPRYDQCSGWHHLASDLGHHADLFGNQGKSLFSLGLVDICNYFLYTKTKLVRQITIRLDLLSIHFENIT